MSKVSFANRSSGTPSERTQNACRETWQRIATVALRELVERQTIYLGLARYVDGQLLEIDGAGYIRQLVTGRTVIWFVPPCSDAGWEIDAIVIFDYQGRAIDAFLLPEGYRLPTEQIRIELPQDWDEIKGAMYEQSPPSA